MESIKENSRFRVVYARGKKHVGRFLVLYLFLNRLDHNRYGITVSKKLGKAVMRNKVRRRIKESFRLLESKTKTGFDIVVVAKFNAAGAEYSKISKDAMELLRRAQILEDE